MKREYADCYYCGGHVEEQSLPREIWREHRLLVVENVPMGVCRQCGEKFLKPDVAKALDKLLETQSDPHRTMEVGVYALPDVEKDAA